MAKAALKAFKVPDMSEVTSLMIDRLGETTLKPDTPVIGINRGRKDIHDMWDGNSVTIPVGHFRMEYGAALHFQRRNIVPGTRQLEVGGFVSWISILGSDDGRVQVDPKELCQPFTDEDMQTFGESLEGLSREGRAPLTPVRTSVARASSRTQGVGASFRPQIDASQQVSDAAAEAAEHVFDQPTENLARQAEAEAAAEESSPSTQGRRRR